MHNEALSYPGACPERHLQAAIRSGPHSLITYTFSAPILSRVFVQKRSRFGADICAIFGPFCHPFSLVFERLSAYLRDFLALPFGITAYRLSKLCLS